MHEDLFKPEQTSTDKNSPRRIPRGAVVMVRVPAERVSCRHSALKTRIPRPDTSSAQVKHFLPFHDDDVCWS